MTKKEHFILQQLQLLYPDPKPSLKYKNTFELLVMILLSAQTTDVMVNKISPQLFTVAPTVEAMSKTPTKTLEEMLHPLGFFREKAKNIKKMSTQILQEFHGNIPYTLKKLQTLAGVGRKTASVLLIQGYNIPAFPVDTHIIRITHRLELSTETNPSKISDDLMHIFPKKDWKDLHLQFIFLGRNICTARNPQCKKCPLFAVCAEGKLRV